MQIAKNVSLSYNHERHQLRQHDRQQYVLS